jgi:predicted small metal-binding protein
VRKRPRERKMSTMKTMTCQQLGGPCDLRLQGASADDVIKAQDRHLKDAVKAGDASHEQAHQDMKNRWRHPVASMGWYRDTKKAFAALPED